MSPLSSVPRLLRLSTASYPGVASVFLNRTYWTTGKLYADENGKADPPKKPFPYMRLEDEPPMDRFKRIMKWDFGNLWDQLRFKKTWAEREAEIFPSFCDVLIVGGGIMGSTIAYYMKAILPEALTIVVVEKDPSYKDAASTNSMGTIRVQFSDEQNVRSALFGAEFLRTMKEKLNISLQETLEPKDVEFNPQGFLFLGTLADMAQMEVNHETQIKAGAKVALLTPALLRSRYPWMNFEDIALGSYGLENEGWYDTWTLLYALKEKNMSMGIYYVHGEVVDFAFDESMGEHSISALSGQPIERLKDAIVLTPGGVKPIQFAYCVNAAGHEAGNVAKMTGLGSRKGLRILPLPIEKRKRYMYMFHCPDALRLSFPILVDPNGLFVRRHGLDGNFMCSWTPKTNEQEPDPNDKLGNEAFFNDVLWPKLAFRVPAFKKLTLNGAWATFYDYNYFDQSGVIGHHPYYNNFLMACGFSGYGLQMAPAVGKALQELIMEFDYINLDMKKFDFLRFVDYEPAKESVLV